MPSPQVTVVIPTLAREARLAACLEALAAQTLERRCFEVIVVRAADGPGGALAEAPEGLEVTFLASEVRGAAAQRNLGWRSGSGELVAFTDDDCRPSPDWLERLLAAREPETILQGRTEPDPDERQSLRGYARSMSVAELDPWAATCNAAYPRELLERVGGFDENFPAAWGEDTDLALRSIEGGARQAYVPGALVWHAVHPRTLTAAIEEGIERSNIHIVIARHPRQRRALHFGVFASRSRAYLLLALALGLLLRRRPPLRALAVAPYYFAYFDRSAEWTPQLAARWLLVSVPRRFALDAAELAAMAASSAKHRTLVL